ncbi:MAG: cytochrome bc complex cytochrome b subunit [Halobacteriales archaeon]
MSRTRRLYGWFDDRLDLEDASSVLGKAFPAEDSFLLGEVALFSFVMLGLTGIFLGFFYEPSTSKAAYEGSVARFQGEEMPAAFVSVLQITYDVPFGMFIRRLHHWAAHLFVASIGLHMLRVYFTGAYRTPREINWIVGVGLAILAMAGAYTGYALPFDEFAATATGIGYNMAKSVPLLGDPISAIVFGGEFPSSETIPRLYFLHVLVIPVLIAAGLAAHMAILVRQKHTEAERDADVDPVEGAGPAAGTTPTGGATPAGDATTDGGADDATPAGDATTDGDPNADGDTPAGDSNADGDTGSRGTVDRDDDSVVVGLPAFPNQAAVSAVVFFLTLAVLSLLAGLLPVHNIAEYGPNNPAGTPDLIMPDWFLMWLYGFLKLAPSWLSFEVGPLHFSTEFLGGLVLPGLVFLVVIAWPFIDRSDPVHFSTDPLDRPWQTAAGVAGVVFIMIGSIAGMNNLLATALDTTTNAVNPLLLVALVAGPIVAFAVVYRTLREPGDGAATGHREGDG